MHHRDSPFSPVDRRQRRDVFRVSVEPNDRVIARLFVPEYTNPLPLRIGNLSSKGIGASLASKYCERAGLTEGLETALELLFGESGQEFRNNVRVVSVKKLTDLRIGVGLQWLEPTAEFSDYLRGFAVRKERVLLRRRSGLWGL